MEMKTLEAAYKMIDDCDRNLSTLLGVYAKKLVDSEDVSEVKDNIEKEKIKRGKALRTLISSAETELPTLDSIKELPDVSNLSIDELGDLIVTYQLVVKYTDRIIDESTDITNPKNINVIKLNRICLNHLNSTLLKGYRAKLLSTDNAALGALLDNYRVNN